MIGETSHAASESGFIVAVIKGGGGLLKEHGLGRQQCLVGPRKAIHIDGRRGRWERRREKDWLEVRRVYTGARGYYNVIVTGGSQFGQRSIQEWPLAHYPFSPRTETPLKVLCVSTSLDSTVLEAQQNRSLF